MASIEVTPLEAELWMKMVKAYRVKIEARKDGFERTAILEKMDSLIEKLSQVTE